MFRSKRNSLVKLLWKYKINDETKGSPQKDKPTMAQKAAVSLQEELELKSVTHSFLKRLKVEQLEVLVRAMESRGGEVTPCVPVSRSDLWLGKHVVSPYVLCCRVFRWPDLRSDVEMKRLPSCTRLNEDKEAVVCCNPYHWSVVVKIDELPTCPHRIPVPLAPSQRKDGVERVKDDCPRIIETDFGLEPTVYRDEMTESTDENSEYNRLLWCTVAYWELRERVGRLFSVTEPSVHIFQHLPRGDGMCLRLFQKPTNQDVVKRTREKIGFGIILSREAAHRNNVNVIRLLEQEAEDGRFLSSTRGGEISVLPRLSPSELPSSSSEQVPSSCKSAEGLSSDQGELLSFPSTSDTEIVTPRSGVYRTSDNLDVVQDAGGDVRPGCGWSGVEPQPHVQHKEGEQYCDNLSVHVGCIYDQSIDYMPAALITSPQTCDSHMLQWSRSHFPSSTSSFSSSSPSSSHTQSTAPLKEMSARELCCTSTGSRHEGWMDLNSSTHVINNNSNSYVDSNNRSTCSKKATTQASPDNHSKNSRTVNSTSSTSTRTVTALSSNLPWKQGEVWAYNASDFPIFVNSPTLDNPQSPRSLVVKKVPPGYSIKIFDYSRAKLLERTEARSMLLSDGPFDPCSVRISLAKGWGPSYSRQFITSCPCWLEVLLGVRRHNSAS